MAQQKNEQGAELIHQAIPDVDGTEARLSIETLTDSDHVATRVSCGRFEGIRREWTDDPDDPSVSWALTDDHGNGFGFPIEELPRLLLVLDHLVKVPSMVGRAPVAANSGIAGPMSSAKETDLHSALQAAQDEITTLKAELKDYEEVLADKRRLTRELDVALFGDGAAKQASLCDLIEPARKVRHRVDQQAQSLARLKAGLEALKPLAPLVVQYVIDNADDHDEDCPCDDTCDCSFHGRNFAINELCRFLDRGLDALLTDPPDAQTPERT